MSELDDFKRNINLSEFAASFGYSRDVKESTDTICMMRAGSGDKIAVKKAAGTGFWIYCSNRDASDNGTIIDFVQHREGGTLGNVRKRLRQWSGAERPTIPDGLFAKTLLPSSVDRNKVLLNWEKARFCYAVRCLTLRGIGPETLSLKRFYRTFRVDDRGNVLFPHHDKKGLCGFEIKNTNFTGFAAGGVKGLWHSKVFKGDNVLVLSETAIDSISHAILKPQENARYMSTGGTMNPEQPALIAAAMAVMPPGSTVLLAFDADQGGDKLAEEIEALAPLSVRVVRDRPAAKDWNQVLKNKLKL